MEEESVATVGEKLTRIKTAVDRIRTKTDTSNDTIEEVAGTVEDIVDKLTPIEEKDVNFYDYDGTRLYSYTASEFANLTEMPSNPSHAGLTAQGWNWTLADAKAYVADAGVLDIGQIYNTDDGATRLYLENVDTRQITLNYSINGTATIDWGDNSATDQISGSSLGTYTSIAHSYEFVNKAVIKITIGENTELSFGGNQTSKPIFSTPHNSILAKVEFGANMRPNVGCFYQCYELETVTLPSTLPALYNNCFENCTSLKAINLPSQVTYPGTYALGYCYSLKKITCNKINGSGSRSFQYCYCLDIKSIPMSQSSLPEIFYNNFGISTYIFPSWITNIGNFMQRSKTQKVIFKGDITYVGAAFNESIMHDFLFLNNTAVPTLGNTNCFTNLAKSNGHIVVPDVLYEDWKAANNWSAYAQYIVKASDYSSD